MVHDDPEEKGWIDYPPNLANIQSKQFFKILDCINKIIDPINFQKLNIKTNLKAVLLGN